MKAAKKEKKNHGVEETKMWFYSREKKKKEERKVFEFDILVEMLVIDDKKSGKDFFWAFLDAELLSPSLLSKFFVRVFTP